MKTKELLAFLSLAALKTLNLRLAFCCLFYRSLTTLHSKGLGFLNGVLDIVSIVTKEDPLHEVFLHLFF